MLFKEVTADPEKLRKSKRPGEESSYTHSVDHVSIDFSDDDEEVDSFVVDTIVKQ